MCHLLLLLLPPPPPPLTLTLTLSPQVYLFFDNVELFLIFAGNQLSLSGCNYGKIYNYQYRLIIS
jgi:hypothetical protein